MSEATLFITLDFFLYSKVEKLKIDNTKKNQIVSSDQTMKMIIDYQVIILTPYFIFVFMLYAFAKYLMHVT